MRSKIVDDIPEGLAFAEEVGFPLSLRSAFSLKWNKMARNRRELQEYLEQGMDLSPTGEVLVEEAF